MLLVVAGSPARAGARPPFAALPAALLTLVPTVPAIALPAMPASAIWLSVKPRYFLPAFLLALPVARRLAPLPTSVLVPLIVVLTLATTWMGVYLLAIAHLAT